MDRRSLLISITSGVAAAAVPDVAVDVFRDVAAERMGLLSTVQTSHAIDKAIGSLVARDAPSVASLCKWSRRGPAVLRVNSVGILAKVGSPMLDDAVVSVLKADDDVRQLYLTAVYSRVVGLPWEHATETIAQGDPLTEQAHIEAFTRELTNPADSGARWCSLLMLSRTRHHDKAAIDSCLRRALTNEPARELLRCVGGVLAGLDPLTV